MTDELRIRAARRRLAVIGLALPIAVAGCAGTPLPSIIAGPDPADAGVGVQSSPYTPVTAGTVHHQPVDPKPWREMNDRVAPRGGRRQ